MCLDGVSKKKKKKQLFQINATHNNLFPSEKDVEWGMNKFMQVKRDLKKKKKIQRCWTKVRKKASGAPQGCATAKKKKKNILLFF